MIKRGFTLTEVLVTLAIIGVISALTLPTFVSNAENKANAAKLSSLITDVQTAFTSMLTSEAVLDMEETEFAQQATLNDRTGRLSKYLKLAGNSNNMATFYGTDTIVNKGYTTADNPTFDDIYKVKNGALLFYSMNSLSRPSANVEDLGGSVTDAIGYISIDVNGGAKPNIWGRDVFHFVLGTDGALYPAGGLNYAILVNGDTTKLPCESSNSRGCTAKLIEDDFKVNY